MTRMKMLELNWKTLRSYLSAGLLAVVMTTALLPVKPVWAQIRALPDFTDLVEQVGPSVVNIRTIEKVKASTAGNVDEQMLEFFRRFGIPVPPNMPRAPHPYRNHPQPHEDQPHGVDSGCIVRLDDIDMTSDNMGGSVEEEAVSLPDKHEITNNILGGDRRRA